MEELNSLIEKIMISLHSDTAEEIAKMVAEVHKIIDGPHRKGYQWKLRLWPEGFIRTCSLHAIAKVLGSVKGVKDYTYCCLSQFMTLLGVSHKLIPTCPVYWYNVISSEFNVPKGLSYSSRMKNVMSIGDKGRIIRTNYHSGCTVVTPNRGRDFVRISLSGIQEAAQVHASRKHVVHLGPILDYNDCGKMVETAIAAFLCCPICSSYMAALAIEPKTKLKAQSIKDLMEKAFDMLMGVTCFEKMDYAITIDCAENFNIRKDIKNLMPDEEVWNELLDGHITNRDQADSLEELLDFFDVQSKSRKRPRASPPKTVPKKASALFSIDHKTPKNVRCTKTKPKPAVERRSNSPCEISTELSASSSRKSSSPCETSAELSPSSEGRRSNSPDDAAVSFERNQNIKETGKQLSMDKYCVPNCDREVTAVTSSFKYLIDCVATLKRDSTSRFQKTIEHLMLPKAYSDLVHNSFLQVTNILKDLKEGGCVDFLLSKKCIYLLDSTFCVGINKKVTWSKASNPNYPILHLKYEGNSKFFSGPIFLFYFKMDDEDSTLSSAREAVKQFFELNGSKVSKLPLALRMR